MLCCMTRAGADRRSRMGKIIKALRLSQRLTVDGAAARAPMSATTWQRVEDGKPVRALTYRGIEEVLRLPRGILEGAVSGTTSLATLESQSAPPAEPGMMEHLDQTPELTDAEKAALKRMARVLREERDSA
jgi:hypothetical protein